MVCRDQLTGCAAGRYSYCQASHAPRIILVAIELRSWLVSWTKSMVKLRNAVLCLLFVFLLSSCSPYASFHRQQVQDDSGDRISAGTVQREIKKGMTSSEVVSVLGSPNIVTSGDGGQQTWVYDKVATDQVQSSSDLSVFTLIFNPSSSASARSTNQRTLTVIIKFDENEKVDEFSYRQSSF